MRPTVTISRQGIQRIRSGHLWIYRGDVQAADSVEAGCIAQLVDENRQFLGQAFFSDQSRIALRLLTRSGEAIDESWWRSRIREAIRRRDDLRDTATAYRLIHAEADLCPGLVVDRYGDVLAVQTLCQSTEKLKEKLVSLLVDETSATCIVERNDARVRELEGLNCQSGVLFGADPGEVEIEQHGVRQLVSPLHGQKTGTFLDQRENQLAARRFARGRVLDCFAFQGGFALSIARVAESVCAVDISREALERARSNVQRNGLDNVTVEQANVFDFLRERDDAGDTFNTIVLDPPAFAKNRASVAGARRGYKEINLRSLRLLARGGVLITCSCSYHVSEALFSDLVLEAALDAGRRIQLVERRTQSTDHPVLMGMPETHYLKCLILRVLE